MTTTRKARNSAALIKRHPLSSSNDDDDSAFSIEDFVMNCENGKCTGRAFEVIHPAHVRQTVRVEEVSASPTLSNHARSHKPRVFDDALTHSYRTPPLLLYDALQHSRTPPLLIHDVPSHSLTAADGGRRRAAAAQFLARHGCAF
jgi:hypothetical protein